MGLTVSSATRIGVIGAGVMGRGVAEAAAQAGFEVILVDLSDEILRKARAEIRNSLRLRVMTGSLRTDAAEIPAIIQRIACTTSTDSLRHADFVIENIVEKIAEKQAVYAMLEQTCPAHTIFAANTSAIPIARIAAMGRRPAQVLGAHFMNPVPMKDTVEVVRGAATSEDSLRTTQQLLERMGKTAIVVNDAPGFVTNRVLMQAINEAVCLVEEGVASAPSIDALFKSCLGHKMGPLETADLIGLDTVMYSIEVLQECFPGGKFTVSPLLRKMVGEGIHGRKSGRGFYEYE